MANGPEGLISRRTLFRAGLGLLGAGAAGSLGSAYESGVRQPMFQQKAELEALLKYPRPPEHEIQKAQEEITLFESRNRYLVTTGQIGRIPQEANGPRLQSAYVLVGQDKTAQSQQQTMLEEEKYYYEKEANIVYGATTAAALAGALLIAIEASGHPNATENQPSNP